MRCSSSPDACSGLEATCIKADAFASVAGFSACRPLRPGSPCAAGSGTCALDGRCLVPTVGADRTPDQLAPPTLKQAVAGTVAPSAHPIAASRRLHEADTSDVAERADVASAAAAASVAEAAAAATESVEVPSAGSQPPSSPSALTSEAEATEAAGSAPPASPSNVTDGAEAANVTESEPPSVAPAGAEATASAAAAEAITAAAAAVEAAAAAVSGSQPAASPSAAAAEDENKEPPAPQEGEVSEPQAQREPAPEAKVEESPSPSPKPEPEPSPSPEPRPQPESQQKPADQAPEPEQQQPALAILKPVAAPEEDKVQPAAAPEPLPVVEPLQVEEVAVRDQEATPSPSPSPKPKAATKQVADSPSPKPKVAAAAPSSSLPAVGKKPDHFVKKFKPAAAGDDKQAADAAAAKAESSTPAAPAPSPVVAAAPRPKKAAGGRGKSVRITTTSSDDGSKPQDSTPYDKLEVTVYGASDPSALTRAVPQNFLGTSHEWTRIDEYGRNPESISAFSNIFSALGPSPILRIGGASQDLLVEIPADDVWTSLRDIAKAANLRFIIGLPLEGGDTQLAKGMMDKAKEYLGGAVVGYELGNEPGEQCWVRGGGLGFNTGGIGHERMVKESSVSSD